ncbi:MAG: thioredoxin [Bacteroidales bacterium]|nr:thioredoxin [Bacteroidales bacterium]
MAQIIDDSNFNSLLGEGTPMIVDFWATWCGPCRMIAPTIDEISQEYEGKVIVAKCNVDENSELPMKYGIRNIPTLLFFKNGEVVDRTVGAVQKKEIVAKIDTLLS